MSWTQRALFIYPASGLTSQQMDALAQAFVNAVGLETFANERLMFAKAAEASGDYGATTTHRQISTALTPQLATAVTAALTGISGLWYLLDAETEALIATNDAAKTGRSSLDWSAGLNVTAGEVLRYDGQLYEVIQGHQTQSTWQPSIAKALFKQYRAPGEVSEFVAPTGAHDAYPIGARVLFNGDVWRNLNAANPFAPNVAGWVNESAPQTAAWAAGVAYKVGDIVSHLGLTYRVLQAHTSIASWAPPVVPALFLRL